MEGGQILLYLLGTWVDLEQCPTAVLLHPAQVPEKSINASFLVTDSSKP